MAGVSIQGVNELLGNALKSIEGEKQQAVDEMFHRLDESNKQEFQQTLENKVHNTQTQIDHYASDMNNSAFSDRQREEARQHYENLFAEQEKLVEQQKKYEQMRANEEAQMVRYSFESKEEYQEFVQQMTDQNLYVSTSDAQVNGGYLCEVYEADRTYVETIANNNDYAMTQTRSDDIFNYSRDVEQNSRSASVDYKETSQQDYEKAMRSFEYSEETQADGSSVYYRSQRISETEFVEYNDGNDNHYFAKQDDNGNTLYFMKNEVSAFDYDTWTSDEAMKKAQKAQTQYQMQIDELGREHYYKQLDEKDNWDYKKVDANTGETVYYRFDNSQNFSADRSFGDKVDMAKSMTNNGLVNAGAVAVMNYNQVGYGQIGSKIWNEVASETGVDARGIVNEFNMFVNTCADASKRFDKNGDVMPEDFKAFHRISAETAKITNDFAREILDMSEADISKLSEDMQLKVREKQAFASEMTNKYGAVVGSFGMGLTGLTPKQMIEINAEFIKKHGDLVLDAKGRVDFSRLSKMTATQLKVHGISIQERDFIFNVDKALNLNGKIDVKNMSALFRPVQKLGQGLKKIGGNDLDEGFSEVKEAGGNLRKTNDARQKIVEKYKDVKKIQRELRERRAIKNAKSVKKVKNTAKKTAKNAGKKMTKKAVSDKLTQSASEKYATMMAKKLSERFAFLQRMREVQMMIYSKLGQTAIGSTLKAVVDAVVGFATGTLFLCVGIGAGIFALLCFGIVIVIIVYTGITSLFDVYTGRSVCESLAITLQEEEQAWYDQLLDVENLWANREEYKYDHYYRTYDRYVGASDNTSVSTMVNSLYYKTSDSTFWVCPWSCAVYLNDTYCKNVTAEGFAVDGVNNTQDGVGGGGFAFELDTNYNLASEVTYNADGSSEVTLDGGYGFPKSGHTSNIKDIIAMADVMFQFDQNSADDKQLQSITNSPFAMDWANFTNNCVKVVKFVGASVSGFFGDDEKWIAYEDWATETETTSFHALQAYCMGLFEASHQEKIFWEVVFLPISGTTVVYDESGNPIDNYIRYTEGTNSQIGSYEENGVTLNGTRAEYCPASLYYDETHDEHWGCQQAWLEMYVNKSSSGAITYEGLGVQDTSGVLHSYLDVCKSNTPHIDGTQTHAICLSGVSNYSTTGTGLTATQAFLTTVQNSDCWELESEDNLPYRAVWSGDYSHYTSTSGVTGTMYGYAGGGIANLSNAKGDCYKLVLSDVGDESESNVLKFVWYDWEATGTLGHCDGGHCGDRSHSCSEAGCHDNPCYSSHTWWECCPLCRNGTTTYTCVKRVYVHNCQGHTCHLCGGHLMANIHGIVYSMTDEQWFCFSGEGAGENYEIVGKIDLSLCDNSSFGTWNRHGQVSTETFMGGINLNDNNTYADWQAGNLYLTAPEEGEPSMLTLAQDIFDIDLGLKYGSSQFPIRNYWEYEAWTQENMQMACAKASADWTDYYKFDIPINITTQHSSLSDSDISRLTQWIALTYQANYGVELDERRLTAIQKALYSVGRGNYSQAHHGHGYYLNPCTIHHSGGDGHLCNKTDCSGFASYIYGVANDTTTVYSCQDFFAMCSGVQWGSGDSWQTNAKPGDILILNGGESDLGWHAVVYCGYIDLPACQDAGLVDFGSEDYQYETECGMGKISQRVPITVDCSPLGDKGNIYLQNCFTSGSYTMSYLSDLYILPLGSY